MIGSARKSVGFLLCVCLITHACKSNQGGGDGDEQSSEERFKSMLASSTEAWVRCDAEMDLAKTFVEDQRQPRIEQAEQCYEQHRADIEESALADQIPQEEIEELYTQWSDARTAERQQLTEDIIGIFEQDRAGFERCTEAMLFAQRALRRGDYRRAPAHAEAATRCIEGWKNARLPQVNETGASEDMSQWVYNRWREEIEAQLDANQ